MDQIRKAMALGQRVLEVKPLIENWCAHASVRRWEGSGVGLVEQMTGLPIGHHYIHCPHARAHGIASMHLDEAALDFHDKNCMGCERRQPVGLPNLSELVAKRDGARRREEERANRRAEERAQRLAERQRGRDAVRPGLQPAERDLLDLIAAVDSGAGGDPGEQLVAAARAARHHFSGALIDQLFILFDGGGWAAAEVALQCLAMLSDDRARLCSLALAALSRGWVCDIAFELLVPRIPGTCDRSLVKGAVHSLVLRASHSRGPFLGPSRPADPGPLLAAYRFASSDVIEGIRGCLKDRWKDTRIRACDAIELLLDHDPTIGEALARDLIAYSTAIRPPIPRESGH